MARSNCNLNDIQLIAHYSLLITSPMRVILQRVRQGSVSVDDRVVGTMDKGFVALVGVTHGDTQAEAELLAKKTANLRVFEDDQGKMNLSALDVGGGVLVISQFTLYADTRKGRRPSFIDAAQPDVASPLVDYYAERLRTEGIQRVEQGIFGAMMLVEIHNDGPVTIILDTAELK
jgi:D-tyrosyl-tRNA(Tyr) deacylase